ncbi:MAG: hypothetical protein AAF449_17300, partial [Myxococcota bacterium]
RGWNGHIAAPRKVYGLSSFVCARRDWQRSGMSRILRSDQFHPVGQWTISADDPDEVLKRCERSGEVVGRDLVALMTRGLVLQELISDIGDGQVVPRARLCCWLRELDESLSISSESELV